MRASQATTLGWQSRALAALLALVISVTCLGAARADAQAEGQTRSATVEWNAAWPRFRAWEYAATGAAWTQAVLVRLAVPLPNRQQGTFWLDEQITDAVGVSGTAADVANDIADLGYRGAIAYRLLDSTVVPGLVWRKPSVMLQMTMIDLEAFAISAFVLWNAQLAFGRERPMFRDCPKAALEGLNCDDQSDERYRAFIAGHTLITTTAAALTCVHHAHLPLYGGGAADDLACAGMIGLAAVVGVSRLVAQQHYATDVLLGWGVGTLAGYVVPSALHYGFGRAAKTLYRPAPGGVRLTLIPGVGKSTTGATLAGAF